MDVAPISTSVFDIINSHITITAHILRDTRSLDSVESQYDGKQLHRATRHSDPNNQAPAELWCIMQSIVKRGYT